MRDIGKNIRDLRISKKMTQDELAAKLFVSRQTLSNYETGRTRPDVEMLIAIAEHLGTDLDSLIYGQQATAGNRKDIMRLTAAGAVTLIFFLIYSWIEGETEPFYGTRLYFLNLAVVRPALFLLCGWTLPQAVITFTKIRRAELPGRKRIIGIIAAVSAAYFILALPYILPIDFAMPVLWQRVFSVMIGLSGPVKMINSSLFALIFGVLLNLYDFPKGRKETAG